MEMSSAVVSVGALSFGIVVGYITYRTLVRSDETSISDIAAVVAAIGGGVVVGLFESGSDAFGWYSIGLLVGMAIFLVLRLVYERQKEDGRAGPLILGD
jgi:hypothetical protein